MPVGCVPLQDRHKRYLESRNFNPAQLEKDYALLGTGPLGEYKWRIIAPILLNGRTISYHSRDITGKQKPHMACPKEDEVIGHKHTFYNLDRAVGPNILIVEGLADNWRLGPDNAIGSFGTSFTQQQINRLIRVIHERRIKRLFGIFDTEEETAEEQVDMFLFYINGSTSVETETIILWGGDPGDLSNEEAQRLRKELLG